MTYGIIRIASLGVLCFALFRHRAQLGPLIGVSPLRPVYYVQDFHHLAWSGMDHVRCGSLDARVAVPMVQPIDTEWGPACAARAAGFACQLRASHCDCCYCSPGECPRNPPALLKVMAGWQAAAAAPAGHRRTGPGPAPRWQRSGGHPGPSHPCRPSTTCSRLSAASQTPAAAAASSPHRHVPCLRGCIHASAVDGAYTA